MPAKRKRTKQPQTGGKIKMKDLKKFGKKLKPVANIILKEIAIPVARQLIAAKLKGGGLKHAGGGLRPAGRKPRKNKKRR